MTYLESNTTTHCSLSSSYTQPLQQSQYLFHFPIFFFIRILEAHQFGGSLLVVTVRNFTFCFCSYFLLIHNAAVCFNKSCVEHNGAVHVHSLFAGFSPAQRLLCFLQRKTSDKCLVSHFSWNLQLILARESLVRIALKCFSARNWR